MGRRVEIRRVMRSDSHLKRILFVMRQEWKGGVQRPSREAEVVCRVQNIILILMCHYFPASAPAGLLR